jgi:hypothetical protein
MLKELNLLEFAVEHSPRDCFGEWVERKTSSLSVTFLSLRKPRLSAATESVL